MKNRKIVLIVALMITLLFVLGGCSFKKSSTEHEKTANYSYNIDGDKVYIKDTVSNVINAKKVSQDFLMAALNRDYNNFKNDAEYQYYAKQIREQYTAAKKPEANEKKYKTNLLTININPSEFKGVEVYKENGTDTSVVKILCKETIVSASEKYLKDNKLKANGNYQRIISVKLIKEDNNWKVISYDLAEGTEI